MPLDQHDLIFCVNMAPQLPLLERLTAARKAGYAGISVLRHEHAELHASGVSDAELRQRVADEGMAVAELDGLAVWLPHHEPPASFPKEMAELLRGNTPEALVPIAAAMGARSITAIEFFGTQVDVGPATEAFAKLCDLAAEHGVLVHLEFLPWGGIPNLRSGWEIVRQADRANGGLLIDSWHLFRGGSTLSELSAIPGDRIMGVQLNDAPKQPQADLAEETQHCRLLPGDGSFDLEGLIRTLDKIGSRAPLGVEVLSDDLLTQPIEDVARTTFEATSRILQRARS